jgi:hypothetical protein
MMGLAKEEKEEAIIEECEVKKDSILLLIVHRCR